jgi:hypothetical protein
METNVSLPATPSNPEVRTTQIPLWLKIAFTAFMAVLVPVYWANYGPTNFLYFCDVALFITLAALWTESALLVSIAAVGIVIPQIFWCIDFSVELCGSHFTKMTSYMVDANKPLFLRSLSLFHGWLPFLLLFLVGRTGYDKRALKVWSATALVLCLISFFFLPPAGALLSNPNTPRNVDYVFGLDDARPQTLLAPALYLIAWFGVLFVVLYFPAHLALNWIYGRRLAAGTQQPVQRFTS